MKQLFLSPCSLEPAFPPNGDEALLEKYIAEFDFDSGKAMKIDSKTLLVESS